MAWASASTAISRGATSTAIRSSTPIRAKASRRRRSRCRARRRSMPCCTRPRHLISTSCRAETARANSPPTSRITIAPWQNISTAGVERHVRRAHHPAALLTSAHTRRGRFITLEGIDGAGKSTHLPRVKELIEKSGHKVWMTREPGGTPLGERLRELLLHQPMTRPTETLLMFAARREHCEREIWPRLEAGSWVVCDRFTDATYAYQGGGHGVPRETIA